MTQVTIERELLESWRKVFAGTAAEDCTIQQYNKVLHEMHAALQAATAQPAQLDCVVTGGPTPLIAAMRCYVESKLGDEVDVPDEIAQ